MGYSCKVVADSIGPAGVRLTTLEVTYPLFVHAEHLRHRVFSFSVASNRAIPTKRILSQVISDPVIPVWFGRNQGGMSAREELTGWRLWLARRLWLAGRWPAIALAWLLLRIGLHKQLANRVLSPWQWVTLLVTGTDWSNFFALRCHPDAQPEMRVIAEMMRDAMGKSEPYRLGEGEWHLPLVADQERVWFAIKLRHGASDVTERTVMLVSAARCARASSEKHRETFDWKVEVSKAEGHMANGHMSLFEHQAQALPTAERVANLRGWRSFRSTIPNESDFSKLGGAA